MIDIHSHLIYGVDDGPSTIDKSVSMIYEAEEAGVKVIFATPHFKEQPAQLERSRETFQEIEFKTRDSSVTLFLGFEVLLNLNIIKDVSNVSSLTLGNSNYLLFELPWGSLPVYSMEAIYALKLINIKPILAHPERYTSFAKNADLLLEFKSRGCLVQLDAASIIGAYGSNVKNFAKQLITTNMVDFIASDAHGMSGYTDWLVKAYRNVLKWVGEEKTSKLFYSNPKVIVDSIKESIYKAI